MACKVLFFDLSKNEKKYLDRNNFDIFDIKTFDTSLNDETVQSLTEEDLNKTVMISVFTTSDVNKDVISKFKNLRLISTRSAGVSHIDMKTCLNRNIAVVNVETLEIKNSTDYMLSRVFAGMEGYFNGDKEHRVL